ncbi:MAG: T9SS type A sorting domain-containing protein [candidate division WOR-3 bacterium]|nr:MAG: T9SS type A sorting domain-containing protein [candidate division WOR-3 bacterium]
MRAVLWPDLVDRDTEDVPGGISGGRSGEPSNLDVMPSVTRGAVVSVAGIADGAEVEVADAAGRVVARPNDGVWNPRGVSPGAHFVRVRTGNQAVVQKVLVLR